MTKTNKKYTGVIVPMVTPVNEKILVDVPAVERILQSFIETGVSPFLLGTTGESVSVSREQQLILVKTTVNYTGKKALVYAGISGNCLEESIENAKMFADYGVDAVVAHLPFYYPLDTDQMLKYYEQLAEKVPCPLILYNNPITTKYSVPVEVIEKLSYHPNIGGIKDSERGMERLDASLKLWKNRPDFVHLTGWAAQSAYALLNGSDGIIPSTGNVVPKLYKKLFDAAIHGEATLADQLQTKTNEISEIYQKDRNLSQSIPALKTMMSAYGLCEPYVLPPMYSLSIEEKEKIKKATLSIEY
jgi:dihydrodipicolinate synthase/N-acetylneuraminate lyase